jgi:hypothetical protein
MEKLLEDNWVIFVFTDIIKSFYYAKKKLRRL